MKPYLFALSLLFSGICFGQGPITLDSRVLLHYNNDQVQEMQAYPNKLKSVNFYYTQSFLVQNNPECTDCTPINANTIDVTTIEHRRAEDRRIMFHYTPGGHFIVLLSRKELRDIYATF